MSWLTWPIRLMAFAVWFAKEVIVCNVQVLRDNLTPGQDSTPGIARCETRCRSDFEVTLLAAIITLTPGTLTMGTQTMSDSTTRVLYVHSMYSDGPPGLRAEIADMETHMLQAIRREGVKA